MKGQSRDQRGWARGRGRAGGGGAGAQTIPDLWVLLPVRWEAIREAGQRRGISYQYCHGMWGQAGCWDGSSLWRGKGREAGSPVGCWWGCWTSCQGAGGEQQVESGDALEEEQARFAGGCDVGVGQRGDKVTRGFGQLESGPLRGRRPPEEQSILPLGDTFWALEGGEIWGSWCEHVEFEMSITHVRADIEYSFRYMSLDFGGKVQAEYINLRALV